MLVLLCFVTFHNGVPDQVWYMYKHLYVSITSTTTLIFPVYQLASKNKRFIRDCAPLSRNPYSHRAQEASVQFGPVLLARGGNKI